MRTSFDTVPRSPPSRSAGTVWKKAFLPFERWHTDSYPSFPQGPLPDALPPSPGTRRFSLYHIPHSVSYFGGEYFFPEGKSSCSQTGFPSPPPHVTCPPPHPVQRRCAPAATRLDSLSRGALPPPSPVWMPHFFFPREGRNLSCKSSSSFFPLWSIPSPLGTRGTTAYAPLWSVQRVGFSWRSLFPLRIVFPLFPY